MQPNIELDIEQMRNSLNPLLSRFDVIRRISVHVSFTITIALCLCVLFRRAIASLPTRLRRHVTTGQGMASAQKSTEKQACIRNEAAFDWCGV